MFREGLGGPSWGVRATRERRLARCLDGAGDGCRTVALCRGLQYGGGWSVVVVVSNCLACVLVALATVESFCLPQPLRSRSRDCSFAFA
jgi:hypothetical protein